MPKVHRMYRAKRQQQPREITERDQQAMCNFYKEGIALETIAEHYRCSRSTVLEALARPWLRSRKKSHDLGRPGARWWESDHSDPLEMVKLYYPEHIDLYYTGRKASEHDAHEKQGKRVEDMDWGDYWDQQSDLIDWSAAYEKYGAYFWDRVREQARTEWEKAHTPQNMPIDPTTWLRERFGEAYLSDKNIATIQQSIDQIVAMIEKEEPEKRQDIAYMTSLLDAFYKVA